jgi:hypothetical protein
LYCGSRQADGRGRWKYLEAGVHRIMINLQEGIDMQTVSISLSQKKPTATDLGLAISSIWEYTRKYFHTCYSVAHTNTSPGQFITSAHHRKLSATTTKVSSEAHIEEVRLLLLSV